MTQHDPRDPQFRHELQRETSEEGMSMTAWAGIAFVLLLFGGVMLYAFASNRTDTAATDPARIERTTPPATTGQGGASSKMPSANEKAQ